MYTNSIRRPQRGHGGTADPLCQLDLIARDLGLDSFELMLKNGKSTAGVGIKKIEHSVDGWRHN